jgi:hypothetical protein
MSLPEDNPADDQLDICGLCGHPGADKKAKWTGGLIYWPGEAQSDSELVHAECEDEECRRAHSLLSQAQRDVVIDDAVKYGFNPIPLKFREKS